MSHFNTIWVVDDDRSIRWVLEKALGSAGFNIQLFDNADSLLQQLQLETPDVILSDIRMPGMDGLELLLTIKEQHAHIPLIIMTAHSDLDSAVASYRKGAFEYLPKPFDIDDAIALIKRAAEHAKQLQTNESIAAEIEEAPEIIGEAPAMQEVFRAIGRLALSHITVLINGESGTGKELVAKALHRHSPRVHQAFIALNMAAIPKDLIEAELFGHEKGAFTGASTTRPGRFEQANGGTLFLDEIGDMPAEAQTRLLRVLSDGQFYRVGGHVPIRVDVRIIAATHRNLAELVDEGRFREDLFHRLNVIRVHLPTLAERREDIPRLAKHFLAQSARELHTEVKTLHPDAISFLQHLPWPGNVRQLENTCRWLTVMASGREVILADMPPELLQHQPSATPNSSETWTELLLHWAQQRLSQGESNLLTTAQIQLEKTLIQAVLQHTSGRKAEAADVLGLGRNTLTRKLKELGIS